MDKICIHCDTQIRPKQHMLQRRRCWHSSIEYAWQHRICRTSVSFEEYHNALKNNQKLQWQCEQCTFLDSILPDPIMNSTMQYISLFKYVFIVILLLKCF